MEKITILSSTNRPNSLTHRVSLYYTRFLQSEGLEVKLLDFTQLPTTIAFSELYGQRSSAYSELIETYVSSVSKFIFISPEYNGSFPGILKLFLDSVPPREWTHKKACLTGVSEGRAGNLRGMDHLNGVLQYLKVNVYHNKLPISAVSKVITPDLEVVNPESKAAIEQQLKGFIAF